MGALVEDVGNIGREGLSLLSPSPPIIEVNTGLSLFVLRHQWCGVNLVDSIFPRLKEPRLSKTWSHVSVPIAKQWVFFTSNTLLSGFQLLIQPMHRFHSPSGGFPCHNLTKRFILPHSLHKGRRKRQKKQKKKRWRRFHSSLGWGSFKSKYPIRIGLFCCLWVMPMLQSA